MPKQDTQELETNLSQFTGTEEWHRWSALFPHCLMTDGAKYLADNAGAYWLMDLIASYQGKILKRGETFQVWTLTKKGSEARIVCTDGNNKKLAAQIVPYTDFPLATIKLYAVYDDSNVVILLPNEY